MTIAKIAAAITVGTFMTITIGGTAQAQTSWTGPYIGGHLGEALQRRGGDEALVFDKNLDGTFGDTVQTSAGANAFGPGFCRGVALSGTASAGCARDDNNSFDGGLRAGYDWQTGRWVVGALVEVSSTKLTDSATAFSTTPAAYTFTRELKGVAALRVRAGWARDNTLGYLTAGVAKANIDHSFTTTNTVNTFTLIDDDKATGYQVGGGLDVKVTEKVSLGLEYLYTSFDDDSITVRAAGPAPSTNPFILTNASGTDFRRTDGDLAFSSIRLTAAYRF